MEIKIESLIKNEVYLPFSHPDLRGSNVNALLVVILGILVINWLLSSKLKGENE